MLKNMEGNNQVNRKEKVKLAQIIASYFLGSFILHALC